MMTEKEIRELARVTVKGSFDYTHLVFGVDDINHAELLVGSAIEQALATVPTVPETMVDNLESIAKFLDRGGNFPSQEKRDILDAAINILKQLAPPAPPKPYSVLVFWQNSDRNGYLNHVDASSPTEAARATVDELIRSSPEEFKDATFEDFHIALVCEGHTNDIKED